MSKTQLKKELASMDRDQLQEIILEAYDARKEFKEYFDYFLNPNIEPVISKHRDLISKELSRCKWNRSKARVSVLKKILKNFTYYKPTPEDQLNMMIYTLTALAATESNVYLSDTHFKYIKSLVDNIILFADKNMQAKEARNALNIVVSSNTTTKYFRQFVIDEIKCVTLPANEKDCNYITDN